MKRELCCLMDLRLMWASRLKAIHLLLITGAGEPVNGVDPGLPPSLPPSSVVRMIFSCLWPEGFTLTPEPLQFLPGSKWPQQQKMQRVPLKLKSLTHQIQTSTSTSSTRPKQFPFVVIESRWAHSVLLSPCRIERYWPVVKYGSTFLTDEEKKDRWKVSDEIKSQNY